MELKFKKQNDYLDFLVKQITGNPSISKHGVFSILIEGKTSAGKTALAVDTAIKLDAPFTRVFSSFDLIAMSELEKCGELNTLFNDSEKSKLSVIVLDDLESIMSYCSLGQRYQSGLTEQSN
ncbi:unnamed protein product [marine sediment metagenome]|uniref:ATPase AAA-type core domain-containing protein n=1 Tax=marine sediment metagenome TaxID=412755 RepID=X0WDZ3_9ZZZZ